MSPDVAAAVESLERSGVLSPAPARRFGRIARGELVSFHGELRTVAYVGVTLVMAGVGVLVQEHLDHIGPLAIAAALALGAVSCLTWVVRRAVPFSPGVSSSKDLAFDYVLLLGALLAGATLAYVEGNFTTLGAAWPWHLLIVSLFYAALAFRYDSRVVFSLALSAFAAWRGVSAGRLEHALWSGSSEATVPRVNAVFCGVLFLVLGQTLRWRDFKAHFEPVAVHAGWLLLLAVPLSGLEEARFAVALALLGAGLAAYGFVSRRFSLLAMGVLGTYVGVSAWILDDRSSDFAVYWFAFTGLAVLGILLAAHRHLQEPR